MKHVIPTDLAPGAGIRAVPALNARARGIYSVRADAGNAAAILAELKQTFENFKTERDKEIADLKKGLGDVVQTEKVDRINGEITKLQSALDETNKLIAALRTGGNGKDQKPEVAAHAQAFNSYFRKGVEANLRELEVKAGLRTDSDPDGGFTVGETIEQSIDRVLGTVSSMRSLASVMSISTAVYKKLVSQGGADAGWVGERQARTETNTPQLSEIAINAMELYANPAATQAILDDSRIDIGQWLGDEVSITFAEKEGSAFVSGDGVNRPRGFASYTMIANANYVWGKVGFVTSGVAAALSDGTHNGMDALLDAIYGLKQGYRQGGTFLMNRLTQAEVRKLKDGNKNYLWQPSSQAGQPATLLGYGVSDDDNIDDIGANKFPIWFGNFKRAYLIVDRFGIRVLRDPYTNKPYVHFYTTKRVGGGIVNFEAIKAVKISA